MEKMKQSINKGYPVLISGNDGKSNSKKINFLWFSWNMDVPSGHTWIIDGYCNMTCTAQHKTDSSDIKRFTTDYVHCNVGWRNANYNGYYISEVFSFNNYANLTDDDFKREINRSSGTSHYYNKSLYILSHIRPKNYPEFLDEK
ncbi:MAG: C10 family peptidase [Treponema sp.]|nr:C10 family peptidase [Treponema sp.]